MYLVARPAHHDRHFLKTEPAPLSLTLSYYCLPFEALDRGPKPPLLLAPMGTGPSMPMWVCGFGGWCFFGDVADHVFYLATNKHLKYETQGEVVSLA